MRSRFHPLDPALRVVRDVLADPSKNLWRANYPIVKARLPPSRSRRSTKMVDPRGRVCLYRSNKTANGLLRRWDWVKHEQTVHMIWHDGRFEQLHMRVTLENDWPRASYDLAGSRES